MRAFLVLLGNKQNESCEEDLAVRHTSYLKELADKGNLVTCGPLVDNQGALLILKAESREHAEELIKADPFIEEAYYKHYLLKEYHEANHENNWLLEA